MQETTILVLLCKPRATWNEVGLYLCWKWVMCLFVLVCVLLLVASVLASVRWLLCGGDGSKEKTKSVIQKVPRENLYPLRFNQFEKNKNPHRITVITG